MDVGICLFPPGVTLALGQDHRAGVYMLDMLEGRVQGPPGTGLACGEVLPVEVVIVVVVVAVAGDWALDFWYPV